MKFEIEKQKIINLLKIPSFIIDANGINPILMGILLECKNQELIAISSNNNLSLKTSTKNLKIKTEGKILVQGKLLYNIVNKIKEKIINFEVVDNSIIRISTPTFSSDLNLLDNVGYPSINFIYQD
jgi:DNA polymerase-3 subunit beta